MDEPVEIVIRPLEPEDYEAAAALVKSTLGEYDAYDHDTRTNDLAPDRMEDIYSEPKGQFWVAIAEGAVVGTVALRRIDDRACQLRRLSVHSDFRRQEVTQRLVEALEAYAREASFRRVIAEATVRQKPAANFLESVGFTEFKRSLRDKTVIVTFEKTL